MNLGVDGARRAGDTTFALHLIAGWHAAQLVRPCDGGRGDRLSPEGRSLYGRSEDCRGARYESSLGSETGQAAQSIREESDRFHGRRLLVGESTLVPTRDGRACRRMHASEPHIADACISRMWESDTACSGTLNKAVRAGRSDATNGKESTR